MLNIICLHKICAVSCQIKLFAYLKTQKGSQGNAQTPIKQPRNQLCTQSAKQSSTFKLS